VNALTIILKSELLSLVTQTIQSSAKNTNMGSYCQFTWKMTMQEKSAVLQTMNSFVLVRLARTIAP